MRSGMATLMSVNTVDNMDVTDRPSGESHLPLRPNRTVYTLGGEKKHGMAPDSHILFGQIFPDSAEVKIAITAIAACEQDRDKSRKWASHLKLLSADVDRLETPRNEAQVLIPAEIEHTVKKEDSKSIPGSCRCMIHGSACLREEADVDGCGRSSRLHALCCGLLLVREHERRHLRWVTLHYTHKEWYPRSTMSACASGTSHSIHLG